MNHRQQMSSQLPVESEHGSCDGHVHWHLSRHPANHNHLLPGVRVEGRVIDILGLPERVLRQARLHDPSSGRTTKPLVKTHNLVQDLVHYQR